MNIKEKILEIKKTIPKEVTIVAATKSQSREKINEAIDAGITIVGENYVKEAGDKLKSLKNKVKIHCIGHLQTNKAKKAVEIFDAIQTVDSEKLAEEINKQSKKINKIMPVLIEVNIAEEPNKHGCFPNDVEILREYISKLDNIKLKGIMTIGPNVPVENLRPYFKKAKKIFDNLKQKNAYIDTLSMGMSDSYKVAIGEGATMVRLGRIIFGERK